MIDQKSVYFGQSIVLTTKHEKSKAISPPFFQILSADVIECVVDTDLLGTFSGEIERQGNALDCALKKCELGIDLKKAPFGLSSEGSFGPHPWIPFLSCDQEILYFIDRERDFKLHISCLTEKTNYRMASITSAEQLKIFAEETLFPSHALMMRPDDKSNNITIFKGIQTSEALEVCFKECMKLSKQGTVWVETDMRAHMNPSRMKVIENLAVELAKRLSTICPECNTPGWGKVGYEKGLSCAGCGLKTDVINTDIYGCPKCDYQEKRPPAHGLLKADPGDCLYCNP